MIDLTTLSEPEKGVAVCLALYSDEVSDVQHDIDTNWQQHQRIMQLIQARSTHC